MATRRYYSVSEVLDSVIEDDELSGLESDDSDDGRGISANRGSPVIPDLDFEGISVWFSIDKWVGLNESAEIT